jgi:hypothetical protein
MQSISRAPVYLKIPATWILFALSVAVIRGQDQKIVGGVVQGIVKDSSGAVIPGVIVTLTNEQGQPTETQTNRDGRYTIRNVMPGTYSIRASYSGLAQKEALMISVARGESATANIALVQSQKQEVTVTGTNANQISTEAADNASALVLR